MGTPDLSKLSYKIDVMTNEYLLKMPKRDKQEWKDLFTNYNNPLAFDLLDKMLQYDPLDRLSAEECLNHPYFSKFHSLPSSTPILCSQEFDWDFDQVSLDKDTLRQAIWDEIEPSPPPRLTIEEKERLRDELKDKL